MATQTGTYTSANDLLSKLGTFASSIVPAPAQWTVNTGGAGGDPAGSQVSFDDGAGFVVNVIPQNTAEELHFQPATAYVGAGTAFNQHTGSPDTSGLDGTYGKMGMVGTSGNYWFYSPNAAPKYLHVVVEPTTGVYSHLMFGVMEKFGTFTGGGYCAATNWRSATSSGVHYPFHDADSTWSSEYVRADGALGLAGSPLWFGDGTTGSGIGSTHTSLTTNDLFTLHILSMGQDVLTQRSPLVPNYIKASNGPATSGNQVTILGQTPDLRFVNLEGRAAEQTILVGGDTWRLFPARILDPAATGNTMFSLLGIPPTTGLFGFAYREIP